MKINNMIIKKNQDKIIPYVWINGEENEINAGVDMAGEGSHLTIVGIFLGSGNNMVTFNTKVVHKAAKTKSMTAIRGVFFDNSSFNNDGLIRIDKGAVGADGYFASKILLFDNAKGRSVPSLEIDENDLKAGHASTVGRPDEEQMFYLRSRGLSEKEAQNIIVSGFFEPAVNLLPQKDRAEVKTKIAQYLEKMN